MFFHRRVRFNLAINAVETDAAEISILQSRLQRAKWLSIGHLIDLSELLRRTSPEEWNFHESRERATEFVVDFAESSLCLNLGTFGSDRIRFLLLGFSLLWIRRQVITEAKP
jgi:hypothetical protein